MPGLGALQVEVRLHRPIPLDLEFACRRGELLALIGQSGSGKSTALRAVAGLCKPSQGRISCAGDVWFDAELGIDLPPQQRSVGLVFQEYALFPHLSAIANVMAAMGHIGKPLRQARALALLDKVHLGARSSHRPAELSGGERQRVAIARALARDPKVLLFDEPFSAVDRLTRDVLREELIALRGSIDIPIVLVTHDIGEVETLADRVAVLEDGRVVQQGTLDDLRRGPVTDLVGRLVR